MYGYSSYRSIENGGHVLPKARREPVPNDGYLVDNVLLDEIEGNVGVYRIESHLEVPHVDKPVIGWRKVAPGIELDHSINGVEELDDLLRCYLTW